MDIEELKKYQIIIYGTGYIADKFYKVLQMNHMEQNLVCFAKSSVVKGECKYNFCVKNMQEIKIESNTLVCIAVHESNLEEIVENVKQRTNQYLWVYPFLYRWLLGGIKEKGKNIEIRRLIDTCKKDLRMAIRLAAIECYYGKNNFGYDAYLRAEGIHCSRETARKRLSGFEKLISSWEQNGYNAEYAISVNQQGEIFDGNHRLSLALYHRLEKIPCDIYDTTLSALQIHGPEAMISAECLQKKGFDSDEIKLLWDIQNQYYKFYNA